MEARGDIGGILLCVSMVSTQYGYVPSLTIDRGYRGIVCTRVCLSQHSRVAT